MTSDPGIICFRHCSTLNVFCKCVPDKCPVCHSFIESYIFEPFGIPYPYANAIQMPVTIVIKPSQGSFLKDYEINDQLHIGIVDTEGVVHEFDRGGILVNNHSRWTDCIAIQIVPASWNEHWDNTLQKMLADPKWKSNNYDEDAMNCFNFVIEFMNNLSYMDVRFINKEDLCEKLLLSKIRDAVKYNALYKNLQHKCFFISS